MALAILRSEWALAIVVIVVVDAKNVGLVEYNDHCIQVAFAHYSPIRLIITQTANQYCS